MNKKVVQVDNYDEVELWAGGLLQMRLKFKKGKLLHFVPFRETLTTPGIITALKEEGLLDEQDS